jgi:hypothetical protein
MLPKKLSGEHSVAVVSVRPSSYRSPKPFIRKKISGHHYRPIDVVDNKLGLVDQGHSRSFWKVQGHSEHITLTDMKSSESYILNVRPIQLK